MDFIHRKFKHKKIEVNIVLLPLEKIFSGYNDVLSFFWEIDGKKFNSYMRMSLKDEWCGSENIDSIIKEYTRIVKDDIDKELIKK